MKPPWERLGGPIDEAAWRDALRGRTVVEEAWDDVRYFRAHKDFEHLARGTILAAEGVVHEYPHLPRIFHLARGLERTFDGPFHIEEKIDGYNVRAAWIGGRALAFSRGGYVCPFTTDRLADAPEIGRFLEAHPRLVACLEVAGPGNPYNLEHPPYVRDDIRFFVFDLLELDTGRFLPPAERAPLLERAQVGAPRLFGTAEPRDWRSVAGVIRELDAEGCEGVVLKSAAAGGPRVKYVTLGADVRDLAATTGLLGAVPRAFLVNRVVQAAFTVHELEGGRASPELCRRMGEALLAPLLRSIGTVDASPDPAHHPREVEEVHTLLLNDERNVDRLLAHLDRSSATVQLKLLSKERGPDGRWHVRYAKKYQQATGYFLSRLIGQTFVD